MKHFVLFLICVFAIFSCNTDASSLSNKKILFDAVHGQDAGNSDWFIDTSYSTWADELESHGAEINSIEEAWSVDVISDFDVFIIPEPQIPFTADEKDILDELFENGVNVLLLANGAGIDGNKNGFDAPTIITDYFVKYDISCNTNNFKGTPLKTTVYPKTKIIDQSDQIACWGATNFSGELKPVIRSSDGNIFLGYTTIKNSRVMFCGDTDMFGDGTGTAEKKLYDDYKLYDHRKLSVRIIEYLAGIITPDESTQDDSNIPGEDDTFEPSDNPIESQYNNVKHLTNDSLVRALHKMVDNHRSVGYTTAKSYMFGKIDNYGGKVYCCYTDLVMSCSGTPNQNIMNCEHTWPQSKFHGSDKNKKKSDLHHLFPTDAKANSRRGNHPFGYVTSVSWEKEGSKYGTDDEGRTIYEPPDYHKGNVARALFYFSVRYGQKIEEYEESVLKEWAELDPVDAKEFERNNKVYDIQKNRNPFIDHPEFISRISDF